MCRLRKMDYFLFALSVGLIVFQVWLDLKIPEYMSETTILIQTGGTTAEILRQGGMMLLCAGGSLMSAFIVGYFISSISARFSMRIRKEIYSIK